MGKRQYVAGRRIKVGYGFRYPGDPVPEAADWKHLSSYLSAGTIIEVDVEEDEKAPTIKKKQKSLNERWAKLEAMSIAELKALAKELDIPGRSKLNKTQLVEAIALEETKGG